MENLQVPALEPCFEKHEIETRSACEHVFNSKDDMNKSVTRLCYGNLYVIGRIWIEAMKKVLVGSDMSLVPSIIPVVKASAKEQVPQKPPPMKYKDLSIYNSPHHEFKDHLEDELKCPHHDEKILYTALLPHVKKHRKETQIKLAEYRDQLKCKCKAYCGKIDKKKKELVNYMRHPDNLVLGRGVVLTAGILGYIVGKRLSRHKDSILRGMLVSGLSVLAAGALCFPKETDENFREVCYHTAKAIIHVYNTYCNKNFMLKEQLPCARDLPEKPKERKGSQCPEKKK